MKPNFKFETPFSNKLFAAEMAKTKIKMNEPLYIGQAIVDFSKILMSEFHYDFMQPKYGSKVKLCYVDTCGFVHEIKTEGFYKDVAKDAETRCDRSEYSRDKNRPRPIGKNKMVMVMMRDEHDGKS